MTYFNPVWCALTDTNEFRTKVIWREGQMLSKLVHYSPKKKCSCEYSDRARRSDMSLRDPRGLNLGFLLPWLNPFFFLLIINYCFVFQLYRASLGWCATIRTGPCTGPAQRGSTLKTSTPICAPIWSMPSEGLQRITRWNHSTSTRILKKVCNI